MTRDAARPRSRAAGLPELLSLASPVMLARLGGMAMGLTNTIVVGRYSSEQLGFQALGWAPTAVVVVMSMGLLSGVQVMTARAIGEGQPRKTGAVLRRGLSYAAWVGLASAAALFVLGPAFLRTLGLHPALAAGAGAVVQVLALSMPFELLSRAAATFLEGLARPVPAMAAIWGANLVNLGLNLLLVPGAFGLEALGAQGSAWATVGARATFLVLLLVYIVRMRDARALGVFERPPRDRPAEAEQRRISYGAGASLFAETAAFAGMNIVAGRLGGLAVAGWAIVANVSAVVFMVPLGLAAATSVLVATAYGARDRAAVIRTGVLGFSLCVAFGTVISLVVWPAAPLIARAFATDPALIRVASGALALATLFFVADALQVVASMALRARGDVWVPTGIHVASYALVMLPLGWVLAHPVGLGLSGIVWSAIVASVLAAGLLLWRFWFVARQQL